MSQPSSQPLVDATPPPHRRLWVIALAAVALVALANALWGLRNIDALITAQQAAERTHEVSDRLSALLSTLKDAETGQRGYLLSNDARYLVPYREASTTLDAQLTGLRQLVAEEPEQLHRLDQLQDTVRSKQAELMDSLRLADAGQRDAAIDLLKTNRGLDLMRNATLQVQSLQRAERDLHEQRSTFARTILAETRSTSVLGGAIGLALTLTLALLLRRDLRLHAESAARLRAQRDWLETTLHSIADAVIVTDRAGHVVLINAVAERLLGDSTANVTDKPIAEIFQLFDQASGQSLPDPVSVALDTAQAVVTREHLVLRRSDGQELAIEDSAALSIDVNGAAQGAVMVFRDVTPRRQAELALRTATQALAKRNSTAIANERILETLLEHAPIGIFMTGPAPEFPIVAMSRTTREWIGDQTHHIPADAAYHKLLPDGSIPQPGQLPLHRVMREGSAVRGETWIISRANGPPLRVAVDVAPVRADDGTIVGAVHCWTDLSEHERLDRALQLTETRLGVLLRSNVIGLILNFRRDGTVVDCNTALLDMLGFSRRDLKKGAFNLLTQTPEAYRKKDERIFHQLARNVSCLPFEKELLRKDSQQRISVVVGYAAIAGSSDEYVGFVLDVTERKELELRLRQRTEDLLIADKRKDHFLAMLAHELRNPLGSLRNSVYLLEARTELQAQQALLPAMRRQLDHLVRMIDDLLDVARISQDKITLEKERVDLQQVLQAALEIVAPQIKMNAHHLHRHGTLGPLWVMGDHTRLVQTLANLLHNAAKYTPIGGEIDVTLEASESEAIVRVRDNGQGIDADLLPHIFNAFTQADQSLARTSGGLGVGLAVVRRLTELHGGRVSARSAGADKGSEFELRLPRMDDSVADAAPPSDPTDDSARAPAQRVLVVDDNADLAASTAALLELWGHRTLVALSGRDALDAMPSFQPNIVLLDIGLPGMDGPEVARTIRADSQYAPVRLIAVSGYGQPADRQRATQAGFDQYLVKPLRPSVLRRVIEATMTTDSVS